MLKEKEGGRDSVQRQHEDGSEPQGTQGRLLLVSINRAYVASDHLPRARPIHPVNEFISLSSGESV